MDRTLNEARSIREVVDMIMTYNQHSERILLAVTCLGKQSMILGFTWLDKHNLEIDFRARSQYFAVPRRYRSEPVGSKRFQVVPTRFQPVPSGFQQEPVGIWSEPVGTSWDQPVPIGTKWNNHFTL